MCPSQSVSYSFTITHIRFEFQGLTFQLVFETPFAENTLSAKKLFQVNRSIAIGVADIKPQNRHRIVVLLSKPSFIDLAFWKLSQ